MGHLADQNITVYLDEASMANINNGKTSLPVETPQVVDESKMGLVPQAQAQRVAGLFGDQQIL